MTTALRIVAVATAVGVFGFSLYLLLAGSPLLTVPVFDAAGLPLGNLTTWAGICSLPIAVHLLFQSLLADGSVTIRALGLSLRLLTAAGACWGLVGFGLSGNWGFNFSGSETSFQGSEIAWDVFVYFSMALVILPLAIFVALSLIKLMRKRPH